MPQPVFLHRSPETGHDPSSSPPRSRTANAPLCASHYPSMVPDDPAAAPSDDPAAAPSDDPAAAPSDDAFFDIPDAVPSLPLPPPPPHAPYPSVLRRRRSRGAKVLNRLDHIPSSPSASSASAVTTADEPVEVEPSDSSDATSVPRSPSPPPKEMVDKEAGAQDHTPTVTAEEPANVEPAGDSSEASTAPHPPSPTLTAEEPVKVEPCDSSEATSTVDKDADAQDHMPTPTTSVLESLAVFVIKAVEFQVSALISCLTFPFRLLQWWFLFMTDPPGSTTRARAWALGAAEQATAAVTMIIGGGEGVAQVAGRLAWGALWAVYVGVLLCALLAMAFMAGALLVGRIVEEPIQATENLNFDYTKPTPVAFVPVRRLVPPDQRMQLEVLLTLPESDYNRRLGIFQVRAELLSADGKVLSSTSQPCMLKFKSVHVHFVETFLQSFYLLSGYSSESQVIRLRMNTAKQALEPVTLVKIILEQRAEFSPGAGIPEIYAASLKLEAGISLLKRILWNWRWTIFVWISMGFFVLELLFALVCCRPCIFPRSVHNDAVAH